MSEEMEDMFDRLFDQFNERRFADLRIALLDMEPAYSVIYGRQT